MFDRDDALADNTGIDPLSKPITAEQWLLHSQVALAASQLDVALDAVQQALAITADLPSAQYQMAYVLRAQSDVAAVADVPNGESQEDVLAEALDWYAQAFLLQPRLGDSLGWCRAMVIGFARFAQAMPIAQFWTVQRPDEAMGWFMYGTCRLAAQQPASVCLLRAWALDQSIADLPNNLGGAYLLEGDLAQAEHWLGIALARQPTDDNTLSNVALLRRMSAAQSV